MEIDNKQILFFDLDGTLAPSKSPITDEMAPALSSLINLKRVAIISGGAFPQFDIEIISKLSPETKFENLFIMPTTGAQLYTYVDGAWVKQYSHDLTDDEIEHITNTLTKAMGAFPVYFNQAPFGEIIENRGSQVSFSALGQNAPLDKKITWDPDGKKRLEMLDYMHDDLQEFSAHMGGTTTIDISKGGIDKQFGIQKLLDYLSIKKEDALFVGDKIVPGGNDYPAKEMGLTCLPVTDESETLEHIKSWIQ